MKLFAILGSLMALLAVATGAFGAHALASRVDARMIEIWETAARYQMYHALALFVAAWLVGQTQATAATVAGWSFFAGIMIFSGSLYLLVLTGTKWLGAITPIGGTAMIVGWICCLLAALQLGDS
ncbi:MAG: DUF423 domain-containing protein [Bradymonadaceae bacterium]|nr:DUF423 domain-containing protein [Lujinxingiaceae bacterium]